MVEADTVSEAASTSDDGAGPPEGTGENVVVMEEENENGVVEADKEAVKDEAVKREEENGTKEEEKGEEMKGEEHDVKMGEEDRQEEEKQSEEVNEEPGDVKMNEESDAKEEMETKEEVISAEMEEEGDVKEEDAHGNVEKKAEESSAKMEEEGDVKEKDEHGKIEKKAEESKEENKSKKRRRGQRGEGKRKAAKVEKEEVKEKGVDEEKGGVMKKEAVKKKGAIGKKKAVEEKGAIKKEEKNEKKGEAMKKKVGWEKGDVQKDVDENKGKEMSTPITSCLDRPVREKKSVERLVVALENEPVKELLIEKGRGTPLNDIPNVAYKLSKKKSDDTVKLLHAVIYGRRGKGSQIKSNISQFSGFVWHENEEKQQAKVKERLDKYVKNKLMEFCDVLDIPVTKTTVRKEDLVSKLLDFLMAPHATTDAILAEKDQPNKANKRKGTVSTGALEKSGSTTAKRSARKRRKIEDAPKAKKIAPETEDEDEQEEGEKNENGVPDADEEEPSEHSESEKKEDESEEKDEDLGKRKHSFMKSSRRSSAGTVSVKKARTLKKVLLATPTKSSMKTSSTQSKSKTDDTGGTSPRVFSRKKKNDDTVKTKPSTPLKSAPKERTGKKVAKGKDKPKKKESGPSAVELRKTICEILKEVDFNTATFTDILKQLAHIFKADLTSRKSTIKLMIHEELTKLADEAEDDEDDESDDEEENPELAGKVEA